MPDDDLDPREYPDPDIDENGQTDTKPCPYCRFPIYEGAEQCPKCGNYISEEEASSHKPWWLVAGILLCLAIAFGWIIGGC